jgi:hypothetical protein
MIHLLDHGTNVNPGNTLSYGNGSQGIRTHDGRIVDSTGAFYIGELERLDPMIHMPLADISWSRDIDLRSDVGMGDEFSSFTLSNYNNNQSAGGALGGKSWAGKATNQMGGDSVDIAKIVKPLTPWARELKYTLFDLESAARLGRPIDSQLFEALRFKHQWDIDTMVYIGDSDIVDPTTGAAATGLINNGAVSVATVANGVSGMSQWVHKTPQEILTDVNNALVSVWASSGYAVMPDRILLPPAQFAYLTNTMASIGSTAAAVSILKFLLDNNIAMTEHGVKLTILPLKWAVGAGTGGTIGVQGTVDRMVVYSKKEDFVRFPMVPMQRTPIQFDGIYHKTTYYCRLGQIEVVRSKTMGYFDGI